MADTIHLYDTAVFRREVPVVIAEGINARARWIPVAWPPEAEELAKGLEERGCRMQPEACTNTQQAIEWQSIDIEERMRSQRWKVDRRLGDWLEEFRTFTREDGKVPMGTHPLMAASRYLLTDIKDARRQIGHRKGGALHPRVAII